MPLNWRKLEAAAQIGDLAELSREQPVAIFKHSTRCGISHLAKHQLEQDWPFSEKEIAMFIVDVLHDRPVSNEVSRMFDLVHQSPQLLLLRDGVLRYHTSHHLISAGALQKALASAS